MCELIFLIFRVLRALKKKTKKTEVSQLFSFLISLKKKKMDPTSGHEKMRADADVLRESYRFIRDDEGWQSLS